MSSIAKTSISLSKKDLTKSRIPPVGTRSVIFYHKASAGQQTINLFSLTFPSAEMPFVAQASPEELSSARLITNKKNLELTSSAKGPLIQGLDYIVVDSATMLLIGPYEGIGTEVDEIFVGKISQAPISDLVVASSKSVVRSYSLPVGQNTLNLAHEFKVGEFSSENIGIIKLFVNGVLAQRNTGNSSVTLDKDYYEVDSGSGYGSTVYFNVAPVGTPHEIIVDFGVQAITDFNAIGTIESLSGSVKKLADDVAVMAGTTAGDYLNANPSEVERRGFGDMVLDHESRVDAVEAALPLKADINGNAANLFSVANATSAANAVALGQFDSSLATNGYQKLPSGLIMQWGTVAAGVAVTFPMAFPTQALNVVISVNDSSTGSYAPSHSYITSLTTTGFTRATQTLSARWFAIGY